MFIYRFVTNFFYTLLSPFLKVKFKSKKDRERLGYLKHEFEDSVWIHAASVGEVNAIKALIGELIRKYPHKDFVLSTMTETGHETAKKISPKLTTILFPIDIYHIMKKVFDKLNPNLIILVETEFWPIMLHIAKKENIPIILINGRISDRSFPKYRRFRFFWKPLWQAIKAVNAQSEKDARRFIGFKFNNVQNVHNLKFCMDLPSYEKTKIRKELGYKEDDFVLVWGSSRPQEEMLLYHVLPDLKKKIDNLKIILVPRHLHRTQEVKNIFKDLDPVLYSEMQAIGEVVIVNEMGILNMFYALSDLAIVGGSFIDFGGHNPLEPANYGIPILMGKYHDSCNDSVERLLENDGIVISDKQNLKSDIIKIADDPKLAKKLGLNAKKTLELNSDSLDKNLKILADLM